MLSAKFKIILIVFGVLIGLYFIQYMVTSVNSVTSRKEKFENDIDETPNQKPKKEKKKEVSDKEVKLSILEHVDEAFTEFYPKSDKKPVIFELLTRKDEFDNIKEKFTEDGSSAVGDYIKTYVKKTMKEFESDKVDDKEDFDEETKEHNKPIDSVIEKMEQNVNASMISTELTTIMTRLKELKTEVDKIKDTSSKPTTATTPTKSNVSKIVKETFVDPPKQSSGAKKTSMDEVIEGFEERISYASY